MEIKVGCCGFAGSQQEYFRLFPVIEIQNTFYKLARLTTAEKWRAAAAGAAAPGFEFTMKAWQLITHEPTSPTYRRLGRTIERSQFSRYGGFRSTPEVWEAWKQSMKEDARRFFEADVRGITASGSPERPGFRESPFPTLQLSLPFLMMWLIGGRFLTAAGLPALPSRCCRFCRSREARSDSELPLS